MMNTLEKIVSEIDGLKWEGGKPLVEDEGKFVSAGIDQLVLKSVFGESDEEKASARWLIWSLARDRGVKLASIHNLYVNRATGKVPTDFTVPAMNLRALSYDSARAAFRALNKLNAKAAIFEIARSEISYTDQRPGEYTANILAAAIKEGYKGPVFIQGDHFQVKRAKFFDDSARDKEINELKALMKEAIRAGFYNIDIDTSTLVDLSKPTLDEQQYWNYKMTADFLEYIRGIEPITISTGGEIGEIGDKNSTPEDLEAYMEGLKRESKVEPLISKVSVQTGTVHGGVVLPDGSVAEVKVDFNTLLTLSEMAMERYGMGGAVQHGASTLPDEMFHKFPENKTVEIHLATGFQNIIFDHIPEDLKNEVYAWLEENYKNEWKEGMTREQFYYKSRKRAVGPFKRKFWSLTDDVRAKIREALEEKFTFLFEQLNIKDTASITEEWAIYDESEKTVEDFWPYGKAESTEGLAD